MQYSSKPIFGSETAQTQQESEQTGNAGIGSSTYDRQSPNIAVEKESTSPDGAAGEAGQSRTEQHVGHQDQSGYRGSPRFSNRPEESMPAVTSQTPSSYRPFSSAAPSAGWSTSSPAAGWGSSQAAGTGQNWSSSSSQAAGSSGPSLMQKAKEYLPGQTGSTAEYDTQDHTKDGSHQSLLDKAKEYLPGSNSSRSADAAWQGNTDQVQEQDEMPDTAVGSKQEGTYSRPGGEPVVLGTASAWHTDRDTKHTPDRIQKLSNEAGWGSNRSLGTSSNPDSLSGGNSNKGGMIGQRDSASSVNRDSPTTRGGDARSDFGSNSGQQGYNNQSSGFGSNAAQQGYCQSGSSSDAGSNRGQQGYNQAGGFSSNSGQQGYSQSIGNTGGQRVAYEPATRLPSTGIPPIFHPPSYITSDVRSHEKTVSTESGNQGGYSNSQGYQSGNHAGATNSQTGDVNAREALQPLTEQYTGGGSSSDAEGVNAKQALQPLTEVTAGAQYEEGDAVHAKQALQPLTEVPAGGRYEEADAVHAKDALQPLTEVPAQENKGFVESIREYLPGQQQTDTVEQEQYAQQPGFFDRAKAYVPSLHSSGYSQQTEEVAATPHQSQYSAPTSTTQTDHDEAQPSLLDKAKAYIPVLGSSTDFDPATEARMNQEDRLYQEVPEGDTGFEPEDSHHESLLDKAKAYMPAMGAPGTTTAGIDADTGASAGAPHKGLVEELVEKAKEYLPHQLTGVETESNTSTWGYTGSTGTGYTGSTATGYTGSTATGYAGSGTSAYDREVDPVISGVRLSSRPILGPDAGPATFSTATEAEVPQGMFDRVKQLVGLGPASTTSADRTDYEEAPSSPIIASQGINAGIMGSAGKMDSDALDEDDDDVFVDAPEALESDSFTSPDTGYRQPYVASTNSGARQPYVNQTGPPVVDTSNDPDDTFGPVKPRNESAYSTADTSQTRGPATFGDDDDYEGTETGTPGKKGFRAKMKGKLGAKKDQHQEKKRTKADQDLEQKMQQKEIPKAQAVTTPAAPEQATKAPTAGSNLGPEGGGGMMGGVAGGSPADPHGNAQTEAKGDAAPATAKPNTHPKNPNEAVKQNEHAGGANVRMGSDARQKAKEAPPRKQKSGFMSKLKKPFSKS